MTTAALLVESPPPRSASRITELDGLRGIAILPVIAIHSILTVCPPGFVHSLVGLGWFGVDLFFVLSGYLITGILLDSIQGPDYFRRFYLRRVFRILPIYYLFIVLFFHVLPRIGHATGTLGSLNYGQSEEIWYWVYLSNWRETSHQNRWLRHFWSLSIEEQFYLVWPLIVYLAGKSRLTCICFGCAVVVPFLRYLGVRAGMPGYWIYGLTPFRFEGLALGGLLAAAVRDPVLFSKIKRLVPWSSALAAAALAAIFISSGPDYTTRAMILYGYSSVPVLCWAFVFRGIEAVGTQTLLARFLRQPWLVHFGKYSYGLYVWHLPIAEEVRLAGERAVRRIAWPMLLVPMLVVAIAISYLVARLSWALIEEPFARLKERIAA
jgi:peptidoglycan/LPS O-acetylase OafA/YrhL